VNPIPVVGRVIKNDPVRELVAAMEVLTGECCQDAN
jgi:hypothetical protein